MPDLVHFARLEEPSQAFRTACGVWRDRAKWTTAPADVTCPACRQIAEARRAGPGFVASASAPRTR